MENIILIAVTALALVLAGVLYRWYRLESKKQGVHEKEMRKRMYELAILKEVSDRVGYSLDIEKIVDVITGSLSQFIEYSVASYMLLTQDRLIFKATIEQPVPREFLEEVKRRMVGSLGALLNESLEKRKIEETVTGSIMIDDHDETLRSFFNIPLVISDRVVGVLTVAHTKEGMYKEDEMTILYKVVHQASQEITKLHEVVETEQKKLNAMVESIAEGVVMTDIDYRVLVVNPAARKTFKLEHHEDISIFDLIDALGGTFDIRGKLEESVKLDKVLTADDVLISDRFYQVIVSPVKSASMSRSAGGDTIGGVVIFHDVTHEKEVEKMREDFTSMMVHELRSPLDGIKKMGEMMKSDDSIRKNKTTFLQYIDLMYEGSSDMLELVNDLLDVAKLDAGKFEVHKEEWDIRDVVKERLSFFDTSARGAKIQLASAYADGLPTKTRFDKRRITQVLTNLIANAIKFTEAGGHVTVQVLAHKKGADVDEEAKRAGIVWFIDDSRKTLANYPDVLIVGVTDTGIGIPKEQIGLLFNKFKQLETSARSKDKTGTGLGLVIAKGIAEAHGGTLGVASQEGAGSTFYFTVPL